MNLSLFRRLLQIAYDDPQGSILKQAVIHFIIFAITFSLVVAGFRSMGIERVMEIYVWVHFVIHLIFIFFTAAILHSMDKMIGFMSHTPVTAPEVFYKVYAAASFTLSNGVEYALILIIFFSFGAGLWDVLTFIFILEAMRFTRVFLEFVLAWFKTLTNVRLYLSAAFFFGLLAFLISVKQGRFSWEMLDMNMLLQYSVLCLFAIGMITGPYLVNRLLIIQKRSPELYLSLTRRIGRASGASAAAWGLQALYSMQLMRMLRDSAYIGRYVRLCIIVVILTLVNVMFLQQYEETPARTLVDLSYMVCMVSYITYQLDYGLVKHSHLAQFPIRMRHVQGAIDSLHGMLLLMFALLMGLVEILSNPATSSQWMDGLSAFGIFYLLSIGIPVPDSKISSYQKLGLYFQFFFLSLPVKIAFQYNVLNDWYIQLAVLLAAGLLLYVRKYRRLK
ncbi:hypothetical protein DNH61_05945 [Paenibacillus sambharensis]|uniref:Uncharacterized protein n=1 Tax=Paenibacillus sambharensis TaxID=1803190 RepID=A0A2W1L967_9BACL|nr:hypothetical protein [Paenibacillus sambharensis]PZD96738.1 hypothetical protein DNH61_05945 [Paenibacillus sambharensis]